MLTYTHRVALCSLGLIVQACSEPATEPGTSPESVKSVSSVEIPVTGTWRKMPSIVPARAEMGAAIVDKSIVVVGGVRFGVPLRRVDAYNVETKTWTQLKSLPEPRLRMGATTINGRIYVAGGLTVWDPAEFQPHNSLFVYDPATNTWSRKADMPVPIYESHQANLLGRLYVYAPGNDFIPDYFFAYTPKTDKWVSLKVPPSRHTSGVIGVIDGKLYLTNGSKPGGFNPELDVYDPTTKAWTVKRPMLSADGGGVGAVFHGKLWVAGNEDGDSSARDLQVYDPTTDQWSRGPLMLSSSRWGAAAWAGGRFFVIGGYAAGPLTGVMQALSTSY